MKTLIWALVIGVFGYGLGRLIFEDEWQGWYYPDACLSCESRWIKSPMKLESLDDCRSWVIQIRTMRSDEQYDYECGKNCKPTQGGISVCEETRK